MHFSAPVINFWPMLRTMLLSSPSQPIDWLFSYYLRIKLLLFLLVVLCMLLFLFTGRDLLVNVLWSHTAVVDLRAVMAVPCNCVNRPDLAAGLLESSTVATSVPLAAWTNMRPSLSLM